MTRIGSAGITPAAASATYAAVAVPDLNLTPGADNTAAILAARTAAIERGVPLWLPPGVWTMTDVLPVWSGARILAKGATLDIQTDHSATGRGVFGTAVEDVLIDGLRVICTNATARNQIYGMVSILGAGNGNIRLNDVTCEGGEGVGIFLMDTTDFWITRPRVLSTWADGVQVSRGSSQGHIADAVVRGARDDAIALVSVTVEPTEPTTTYSQMHTITISNPSVYGLVTLGSGISLVGPRDVTVIGGVVEDVPANGVNVIQSVPDGTSIPADCSIIGLRVKDAVVGFKIGDSTDLHLSGVAAKGCSDSGAHFIGSTRATITASQLVGNTTGFGLYATGGTGNNLAATDLRGNGAGASNVDAGTTVAATCITA